MCSDDRGYALPINWSRSASGAGAVSFALAYQKHNAAQAEYDRLAALGSPEAPEILPGGIMSTDAMPRFMDTSKFSLGSPNDPISLGAFPSGHWRRLYARSRPSYRVPRFCPVGAGTDTAGGEICW